MKLMKIKKALGCLVAHACLLLGAWSVSAEEIVQYVHTDALGSPVALSDATGVIVERAVYEPYGAKIGEETGSTLGYTGHMADLATGLTYMQQRYYDPDVGGFLSVDPVTAYDSPVASFGRYRYANGNPYLYSDPDGRAAAEGCTGTNVKSVCLGGGVAGLRTSANGITATEISAAAANPGRYIQALNDRKNSQSTEISSSHYFSRSALPLQIGTGREVLADIVYFASKQARPFSVLNYVLGSEALGDGSGSAQVSRYDGPGERVAIAHTHPVDNNFSGFPARITASGSFSRGPQGDLDVLYRFANNGYLATPNGSIIKFDYIGLRRAMRSGVVDLNATEFVSRVK